MNKRLTNLAFISMLTAMFLAVLTFSASAGGGEDRYRPRGRAVNQERLKSYCEHYVISGKWVDGKCVVEVKPEELCRFSGGIWDSSKQQCKCYHVCN